MTDIDYLLLFYSEWLDGEGVITPDDGDDKRTHEQLVSQFLVQRAREEAQRG